MPFVAWFFPVFPWIYQSSALHLWHWRKKSIDGFCLFVYRQEDRLYLPLSISCLFVHSFNFPGREPSISNYFVSLSLFLSSPRCVMSARKQKMLMQGQQDMHVADSKDAVSFSLPNSSFSDIGPLFPCPSLATSFSSPPSCIRDVYCSHSIQLFSISIRPRWNDLKTSKLRGNTLGSLIFSPRLSSKVVDAAELTSVSLYSVANHPTLSWHWHARTHTHQTHIQPHHTPTTLTHTYTQMHT